MFILAHLNEMRRNHLSSFVILTWLNVLLVGRNYNAFLLRPCSTFTAEVCKLSVNEEAVLMEFFCCASLA